MAHSYRAKLPSYTDILIYAPNLQNLTAASRLLVKFNYSASGTLAIVPCDNLRPMKIDFTAGRLAGHVLGNSGFFKPSTCVLCYRRWWWRNCLFYRVL